MRIWKLLFLKLNCYNRNCDVRGTVETRSGTRRAAADGDSTRGGECRGLADGLRAVGGVVHTVKSHISLSERDRACLTVYGLHGRRGGEQLHPVGERGRGCRLQNKGLAQVGADGDVADPGGRQRFIFICIIITP